MIDSTTFEQFNEFRPNMSDYGLAQKAKVRPVLQGPSKQLFVSKTPFQSFVERFKQTQLKIVNQAH